MNITISAPATPRSAPPPSEEAPDRRLDIYVIYTTEKATAGALREADRLAQSLGARITLLSTEAVPFAVDLDNPPVPAGFLAQRLRAIASGCSVPVFIQIYLCRDCESLLASVLKAGSIVVVGYRRRWWPTKEERLARQLRLSGCEVLLYFFGPKKASRARATVV